MGKRPKLKLPVLKVAISGSSSGSTAALSSSVIPFPPPVVGCTITSHRSLMPETTSRKSSRDELGLPVSGSRTWRCTIAAPTSWASTAESMISSGVMGIAGLCPGTVMPPVIAALMITFSTSRPFRRTNVPPTNVRDVLRSLQTGPRRPGSLTPLRYTPARISHSRGVRSDRRQDRRGPHLPSTVLKGPPKLPPRPCAAGGRGRHPRGGALVRARLQPPAVGACGDPGPGDAREAGACRGLRGPPEGRSLRDRVRHGGGPARARDLRRGAPLGENHAGRLGARGGLIDRLDRRGRPGGGYRDPRHPRGPYRSNRDLFGLPGRRGPTPAARPGAQTPLRDRPRRALRLDGYDSSLTERTMSSAERPSTSLRSSILITVYVRSTPNSKTAACAWATAA